MLAAGIKDLRTREVANIYPGAVLCLALLNNWLLARPPTLLLGLVIGAPFLFAFHKWHIGGADVKMVLALSVLFGLRDGLLFIIISLAAAAIAELAKKLKKPQDRSYAFMPYLLAGYMATLAIQLATAP